MGLLDSLIYGIRNIFDPSGTQLATRSKLKFLSGSGITVSLADNTSTSTTEVTVTAGGTGGGGLPGTPDLSYQYRKADGTFGGQSNLMQTTGGQVNHLGSPVHQESKALFRASGDDPNATAPAIGEAWAVWAALLTTDAAAHTILTLPFPAASYGDARLTAELSFTANVHGGTGGKVTRQIVWGRHSGTLTNTHDENTTIAAGLTAAVSVSSTNSGNDTVLIQVTGVAATSVNWWVSGHVHVVKEP